jgi:hypothetical protein
MSTHTLSQIVVGAMLYVGCSAPSISLVERAPRDIVRAGAVGCWLLQGMIDEPTPPLVRLDSGVVRTNENVGRRVVQRIDTLGRVRTRDGEGFELLDWWSADRDTDTIRIVFNNGLYGSVWALELTRKESSPGSMRGVAKGFGDVVPGPNYPQRTASATRVSCPAD